MKNELNRIDIETLLLSFSPRAQSQCECHPYEHDTHNKDNGSYKFRHFNEVERMEYKVESEYTKDKSTWEEWATEKETAM